MTNTMEWSFPYRSQRMPVCAGRVVATSQPLAAQAGLQMLARGGNAVDAALAAAICLVVVEPTSNGLGSDAFALIWQAGRLHGLNASGRAPALMTPDRYAGLDAVPELGWDAVTTPGAVSAWVTVSERFGSLPFADLFESAIRYAEEGHPVSPITAAAWGRARERYHSFDAFQQTFCPSGGAPAAGERFRCPEMARSLRLIAESQGEAFYRGELAERMEATARAEGGALRREDLEAHRADWIDPIEFTYRGLTLHEIPPNGQGLAALIALGLLDRASAVGGDAPADTADRLHAEIEAMKLAFADAHRYIADPDHLDISVADLLDDAYLTERARLIRRAAAGDPGHGRPQPGGTVYLAAGDDQGGLVSFIQSNYMGFGSGVVIPGTAIAMQNRGCGFSLEKDHPNRLGPGKRPYHTIIPGFLTSGGQPVAAFGVMGGAMQPQGHMQMVRRLADLDQNPQAALDAPRWQVMSGREVWIEPGFAPDVYDDLTARGHTLRILDDLSPHMGGGQFVYRLEDGLLGASDPRKDGQAVGM
jgi:gamma-glutamyltranspeptidase/glutathione hydrolase